MGNAVDPFLQPLRAATCLACGSVARASRVGALDTSKGAARMTPIFFIPAEAGHLHCPLFTVNCPLKKSPAQPGFFYFPMPEKGSCMDPGIKVLLESHKYSGYYVPVDL